MKEGKQRKDIERGASWGGRAVMHTQYARKMRTSGRDKIIPLEAISKTTAPHICSSV